MVNNTGITKDTLLLIPGGNPYASLANQDGDDDDEPTMSLLESLRRPFRKVTATPHGESGLQAQLFLDTHFSAHTSGNPYGTLAGLGDDSDEPAIQVTIKNTASQTHVDSFKAFLSKVDFRSECRRIFLPYVPPHLPRRIPQHQSDFIARNERRSGKARYFLVESLKRYDLSTTSSIAPQFNREHSHELSERKLREIEAKIRND